ncbi:MAG: response regulator transcription factor [Elusimicrobia bacterium]|nr:response regulator transcription factor [Elusimicrobiota bacterium]
MDKRKILIIDDDVAVSEFIKEMLESDGYSVVRVFDGLQAVQMARTISPDLIILDLNLPAGSGETVYERLKLSKFTGDIPVIFVTGETPDRIQKLSKEKNIPLKDIFLKPIDVDLFLNRVKTILDKKYV